VARPAAQPGARRDALGQLDPDAEPLPRHGQRGARGPHREVVVGRSQVGPVERKLDTARRARDHQVVRQIEELKRGFELMKAAVLPREDAQEQVHLRMRGDAHAVGRHARAPAAGGAASWPRRSPARESEYNPSSVIGTNVDAWYATP
jgi:hypothetical protein